MDFYHFPGGNSSVSDICILWSNHSFCEVSLSFATVSLEYGDIGTERRPKRKECKKQRNVKLKRVGIPTIYSTY